MTVSHEGLLPQVEGLVAVGGETVGQLAEYFCVRRLAEVLLDGVSSYPTTPVDPVPELADFVSWRRRRVEPPPDGPWNDSPDLGDVPRLVKYQARVAE